MLGWLKALSLGRKILLGFGAIFAISVVGSATHTPAKSPGSIQTQNTNAVKASNVLIKTEVDTKSIPYKSISEDDSSLTSGTTKVVTNGVNGVETITYKVTYTNGAETDREKISDEVTTQPISQVTAIGTYVAPKPNCDPNYSGSCVPNVYPADVDCASGSGNGPYYVQGPVYVVGIDRYGLDRDGDGVACE